MPEPSRPPELPAGLLTHPEMIRACRVRDFAAVFKLVKTRAGIYPSMIARRCELTPSRVGEVMSGRRQLLHMDVIERIADGLRIPGHMLGLARREWETPVGLGVAVPVGPTSFVQACKRTSRATLLSRITRTSVRRHRTSTDKVTSRGRFGAGPSSFQEGS